VGPGPQRPAASSPGILVHDYARELAGRGLGLGWHPEPPGFGEAFGAAPSGTGPQGLSLSALLPEPAGAGAVRSLFRTGEGGSEGPSIGGWERQAAGGAPWLPQGAASSAMTATSTSTSTATSSMPSVLVGRFPGASGKLPGGQGGRGGGRPGGDDARQLDQLRHDMLALDCEIEQLETSMQAARLHAGVGQGGP
jgi:hypothetical protein